MGEEWVNVGTPLIEQDAEYLKQLIDAESFPCRILELPESDGAEEGRTRQVQVRPVHRRLALQVRANQFPEPGDKSAPEPKQMSPLAARLWKCAGAAAIGAIAGVRVGAKVRGGAMAVAAGLLLGALAFVGVFMITGADDKPREESAKAEETEEKK